MTSTASSSARQSTRSATTSPSLSRFLSRSQLCIVVPFSGLAWTQRWMDSLVETHGTSTPKGNPIECASIRVPGRLWQPRLSYSALWFRQGQHRTHRGSIRSGRSRQSYSDDEAPHDPALGQLRKSQPRHPSAGAGQHGDCTGSEALGCAETHRLCEQLRPAGSNAAMLICRPPIATTKPLSGVARKYQPPTYPFVISAKSAASLEAYCKALLAWPDQTQADETADQDQLLANVALALAHRRNPSLPYSCKGKGPVAR